MPQRAIVILRRSVNPNGGALFDYVLRADVPVGRRPFVATLVPPVVSPFVPVPPDTDPDASGLTNGAVVEKAGTVIISPTATLPQVQGVLQQLQLEWQAEVTNDKTFQRYGSFWNGTAWTGQGA